MPMWRVGAPNAVLTHRSGNRRSILLGNHNPLRILTKVAAKPLFYADQGAALSPLFPCGPSHTTESESKQCVLQTEVEDYVCCNAV